MRAVAGARVSAAGKSLDGEDTVAKDEPAAAGTSFLRIKQRAKVPVGAALPAPTFVFLTTLPMAK